MSLERQTGEIVDDWYDIAKLNDGVWAIGEHYHNEDNFCYLVKGLDQDVLIDTGMGIRPLNNVLSKIRNGKPLTVINTHAHFDHVGGNKYFPYVLAPKNSWEKELIENGCGHEVLENYGFEGGFKQVPEGFDKTSYAIAPYKKVSAILEDGAVINLGDRILQIIATPGHTPGGISILDRSTRALFTSDTIYDGPLYAYLKESNFGEYYKSIIKLNQLVESGRVTNLHPGHNYSESSTELIKWTLELFYDAEKKKGGRKLEDGILEYSSKWSDRLKLHI